MGNIIKFFGLIFAITAIFFISIFVSEKVFAAVVNINTANTTELMTLTGIGEVKAKAIIDYRTNNGLFSNIEDIKKVSGIGDVTFNNIKSFITVGNVASIPEDDNDTSTTIPDTDDTATSSSTTTTNTTTSVSNTTSTHYEAESLSTYKAPATSFSVSAGRERISYVGTPISFEAKYKVTGEVKGRKPNFKWSMGDGAYLNKEDVVHHYKYPGDYNVVLNANLDDIDSISRTKVKVLNPNMSMVNKADIFTV